MKLRSIIYAMAGASVLFLGAMAYLYFGAAGGSESGSAAGVMDDAGPAAARLADGGRTASGKAGKLTIAYAGDYDGSLEPCG